MTRYMFAWELGANYGHLARDLPVAERLRAAGHAVFFAVCDTRIAAELLGRRRFPFVQAPLPQRKARLAKPPANYAEMLLAENWGDRLSLLGCAKAWSTLFALARPDTIIADHAPTALLAARIAGIRSIALGSGFEIPLATHPLPSIRTWEAISETRLIQSEAMALDSANAVAATLGGNPLERLVDLIPSNPIFVTFAELDHYGARKGAFYAGSIHGMDVADTIAWPEGADDEPRLIVYLRPDQKTTHLLLELFAQMKIRSICAIPGASKQFIRKYSRPHLTILPGPLNFRSKLDAADLMVGYGSMGVITESLLAGVPLLMVPQTVEQYLGAKRVEALNAGIVIEQERSREILGLALEKLIADQAYRNAAGRFAGKYCEVTPEYAANRAAEAILSAKANLAEAAMQLIDIS